MLGDALFDFDEDMIYGFCTDFAISFLTGIPFGYYFPCGSILSLVLGLPVCSVGLFVDDSTFCELPFVAAVSLLLGAASMGATVKLIRSCVPQREAQCFMLLALALYVFMPELSGVSSLWVIIVISWLIEVCVLSSCFYRVHGWAQSSWHMHTSKDDKHVDFQKLWHVIASHAFLMFCAAMLVIGGLSYHSAWCCVRAWDRQSLCQTANQLSEQLMQWGVLHWLCKGSLLGAVQAGNPIAWHRDEDICVWADVRNISKLLRQVGFSVDVLPGASVPARAFPAGKGAGNLAEMWIDIVEMHSFSLSDAPQVMLLAPRDTKVNEHAPVSLADATGVLHADSTRKFMPMLNTTAFPLASVSCCGRIWPAPKDWSTALETRFGPTWQTPQLVNRRGTAKRVACNIFMDCSASSRHQGSGRNFLHLEE